MAWVVRLTDLGVRPLVRAARRSGRLWPGRQEAGFAVLVVAQLAVVWAFPLVPTRDGPSHLGNAVMLTEYGSPQTRYHEFFEVRREPFPNWTCYGLLWAFLHLVPPLTAEKLLVSLYVVGFAWAFRYFLLPFGPGTVALAPLGLLFLWNHCLFMGFYNFCLGLVLLWVLLGYCLRRGEFGPREALTAGILFLASYFTHLVSFGLAAVGAVVLLGSGGPRRVRKLGWLAAALSPALVLTAAYLSRTGFFSREGWSAPAPSRPSAWGVPLGAGWLWREGAEYRQVLFEPQAAGVPGLAWSACLLLGLLGVATAWGDRGSGARPACRWPVVVLAGLFTVLHALAPQQLGTQGGFLRDRLALLPPLLVTACLALPAAGFTRLALQAGVYALVGWNLTLVFLFVQGANRQLREFLAGVPYVGHNRTLIVHPHPRPDGTVNYFAHAGNYYCLENHNLDLNNYEAITPYFPLKFRVKGNKWNGSLIAFSRRVGVDLILVWEATPELPAPLRASYREIYRQGRLGVYQRLPRGDEAFARTRTSTADDPAAPAKHRRAGKGPAR